MIAFDVKFDKSNRKAMNRNWSNKKANPALRTKKLQILGLFLAKIVNFGVRPHISDAKKNPSLLLEPIFWRTSLYPLVPHGPRSRADQVRNMPACVNTVAS